MSAYVRVSVPAVVPAHAQVVGAARALASVARAHATQPHACPADCRPDQSCDYSLRCGAVCAGAHRCRHRRSVMSRELVGAAAAGAPVMVASTATAIVLTVSVREQSCGGDADCDREAGAAVADCERRMHTRTRTHRRGRRSRRCGPRQQQQLLLQQWE